MGIQMEVKIPKVKLDSNNFLHGTQSIMAGTGEGSPQHQLIPPFPWAANSSIYGITGRFVHGKLQGVVILYYNMNRGGFAQVKDGYLHGGIITYGQVPVLPVSMSVIYFPFLTLGRRNLISMDCPRFWQVS